MRFIALASAAFLFAACDMEPEEYRTAEAELEESQDFLSQNAERDGVTVTESGLQYEVLEEGEGAHPEATSRVTVHYAGRLVDGTAFDSSIERGEPATFPLDGVIRGWTEGVQLMRRGAEYRFFIPSELAYGDRGRPPVIPPNATLIFDIELIDFENSET